MKKLVTILYFILLANVMLNAQPFTSEMQTEITEKVELYKNDDAITQVKGLLKLFDKGKSPDEKIINSTYAGVAYILSENSDCDDDECEDPAIAPAVWKGFNGKIKVEGIRTKGDTSYPKKGLYSDYVKLYLQGKSVAETPEVNYILRNNLSQDFSPYTLNKNECVINEGKNYSYARINGNDLISLSFSSDMSTIMIYSFKLDKQQQLLDVSAIKDKSSIAGVSYSAETRKILEEYASEEKDRNSFSEMIEKIVNHPEVTGYYHDREMFILSSGLFRNDLEIKYKGKDMLILPNKLTDIKSYIVFTSSTYDGEENHPTAFEFNIPQEGVYGKASFKFKNDNWVLDKISVVEN